VTHVSIIGTGKMGQAIANVSTKGGHRVELLGKDDPATGDIVVLAVPHSAMHDLLQQRSGSLAGKVVVDISNPVDFETFDSLAVPADSARELEALGFLQLTLAARELVPWTAGFGLVTSADEPLAATEHQTLHSRSPTPADESSNEHHNQGTLPSTLTPRPGGPSVRKHNSGES
jgi:NADP oxidoreductase coenzyme F420-dependent